MTAVVTDRMPPILHGPSDKEKKYDRQLRLWAATGQAALEDANILLVNSGSGTVGIETLKNLVLPGIGKFTIADDAMVNEADLGVNFFLDEQCLGKRRSQCCAELLQELNPDVKGTELQFITLDDLLRTDAQYTFIVYTHPIDKNPLAVIEEYSQHHKIPLVSIHSAGFYSYFNIQLPGTFPVVDTHPDSTATIDLRLLSPWPELSAFSREMTANIESLDAHTHGHIPYVALLLYYLEEWRSAHGGENPRTYVEKISFRKMVADAARSDNPEGGEENYDEAVAAVVKTVVMPSLSSSVRELFDYTPDKTEAGSSFWIITDAVKQFYTQHKALPLPGSVPDMKAQSEVYVRLQNIYRVKARRDAAEVRRYVEAHSGGKEVDAHEIETYCKNASFIKLIRSTQSKPKNLKALADAELNAEFPISPTLIPIYLALKASENVRVFKQENILAEVTNMVGKELIDERIMQTAQEVARAKGAELHNIAALTGGMVAQEIIKIITKQYIPIDTTCIFDGITSRTQVLKI